MNREELERLGEEEVNLALERTRVGSLVTAADGVVHALLALRYSVLALAADPEPLLEETPEPPRWCRVELFGHGLVYGRVTEVRVAGRTFLEVVEPTLYAKDGEGEGVPERRRQFNPNAVYALEAIGEDAVVRALAARRGVSFTPDEATDDVIPF